MTPEFMLQLVLAVASALGVYGAVRADWARAIAKAEAAEMQAMRAHDRIDSMLSIK